MSFNRDSLLNALAELAGDTPVKRYLVAFSGGLDSTVLLHALATSADRHGVPVLAMHIDHGLSPQSPAWSVHCESFAAGLGVDFECRQVRMEHFRGGGTEAAAREARYAALAAQMRAGDWLLSAHHRDDQAETLLLNLLRGGGPAGLAGIAARRPLGEGCLARPLLEFSRQDLQDYAARHQLAWVDDPSNADHSFDRNYLRHKILPRLEARWPHTGRRLHRSSRIASEAAQLLDDLAAIDAASLGERPDRLEIGALQSLSAARRRNVLRFCLRKLGFATPSAAQLQQVLDELLDAREDAAPLVTWGNVELRRYRHRLYILPAQPKVSPAAVRLDKAQDRVDLGPGLGALTLESDAARGLDAKLVEAGLRLAYRQGGEKIKVSDQSSTRTLKNLLQEEAVVPWMRDRLPLLFAGGKLVAVADLWLSADALSSPGVAVRWVNRPPIH